jgi:nicotinamidase-related amidase
MATEPFTTDPKLQLLDRAGVALIVIDLQYRLLSQMYEQERLLANSGLLLRLAEVLNLPVILTTQYAAGLGGFHPGILRLADGAKSFDKLSFGCFEDTDFVRHLQTQAPHANTLLLAGLESHICVMQTALGAIAAGYLVHVAADAVSSRTLANWQLGLERMQRAGATITSTEAAIYELLRRAGTPEFKALLPFLK